MAEQVLGPNKVRKLNCGIEKHAKKRNGSSKFSTLADTFSINGGSSSGQPVMKKDPLIHWSKIPATRCNTFVHGTKTSKEWTDLFIDVLDMADYIVLPCQEAEETSSSSNNDRASDQQGDSESETSTMVTRQ
jgi:hypothetical protein